MELMKTPGRKTPPNEIHPAPFLDLDEVAEGFKLSKDHYIPDTLMYSLPTDLEMTGMVE